VVVLNNKYNDTRIEYAVANGTKINLPIVVTPVYNLDNETSYPIYDSQVFVRLFNTSTQFELIAFSGKMFNVTVLNEMLENIKVASQSVEVPNLTVYYVLDYIENSNLMASVIQSTLKTYVRNDELVVSFSVPKWYAYMTVNVLQEFKVPKSDNWPSSFWGKKVKLYNINTFANGMPTNLINNEVQGNYVILYSGTQLNNVVVNIFYKPESS